MKKTGKVIVGISIFATGMVATMFGTSYWLFRSALKRGHNFLDKKVGENEENSFHKMGLEGRKWAEAHREDCKRLAISNQGVGLVGYFYNQGSEKTVVLVHGYASNYLGHLSSADFYYKKGYNVLAVVCRGHKESAGKYCTMGYWDSLDLVCWAKHLVQSQGQKQIVFDGISMGAAAVLAASGNQNLPEQVKGIVSDSSFTTIYDILAYNMKHLLGIPTFPMLNLVELYCNKIGRFSLVAHSPLDSIKRTKVPVLLIHGVDDSVVPYEMGRTLKQACGSECELLSVKGAGHGEASLANPERYQNTLEKFLDKIN